MQEQLITFIDSIITTPSWLLIAFVIITVIFHICFVYPYELTEIQWKRADYFWLLGAVWGFVGASYDLKDAQIKSELDNQIPFTQSMYKMFRRHLESGNPVCFSYFGVDLYSPVFLDFVIENDNLCTASRATLNSMPISVNPPFPTLKEIGYSESTFNNKYHQDYSDLTKEMAFAYSKNQQKYSELIGETTRPALLSRLFFISPLVLAFACALRITKVTGEVEIAKKKLGIKSIFARILDSIRVRIGCTSA